MSIKMEIQLKEEVTIQERDKVYLEFESKGQDSASVYIVVTRLNGAQETRRAEVTHLPTMDELY